MRLIIHLKGAKSMDKRILFIGLDVDDKAFNAYAIFDGATDGVAFKVKSNVAHLLKAMERFEAQDVQFYFCYESTYSAFHLCRSIRAAGHECEVIAAGLIPELSSDRVKNDRLDAEKLARLFMKGMLTNVHVPEEEDEHDRAMIRSRTYLADVKKGITLSIESNLENNQASRAEGTRLRPAGLQELVRDLP
jgi:transposase